MLPPAIDLPRLLRLLGVSTTPARKSSAGSRPLFEIDDEEIPPAISSAQLLKVLLKQPVENKSDAVNSQQPAQPVITTPPSPAPQSPPTQTDQPVEPQPAAPVEARPAPIPGPREKFSGPLADPATRLAFREDSENLTERIGGLLPELERGEQTPSTLRELGRCLHTLKGAAGAVGLTQIAEFVHRLEDLNQAAIGTTGPVDSELLLGAHDLLLQLEHVIVHLTDSVPGDPDATVDHADAVADAAVSLEAPASPSSSVLLGDAVVSDVDETVRVPITRLGELMDLVAELLVLNGPRSSLATRVKDFASTVRSSRNRLAGSIDQLCELHAGKSVEEAQRPDQAADSADRDQEFLGVVRHLSEQADDLLILAENLRGVAVPMADDADIAERLTHTLWDLLYYIRVVPIRPLLQRLGRVARAVAKIEGKQVQVVLEGEDALLDRLVQDKVFEPLLHIVRNAVGHGIEQPGDRTTVGKDSEGTVWITAVQDEDTLTFTVRDDGRGLDYTSIERRARDLGLLRGDEKPDVERLREIVFRSGFSTRAGADALSGAASAWISSPVKSPASREPCVCSRSQGRARV